MALLVDVVGVALEARIVVVSHGLAEVDEALRRPQMLLAFFPCPILPARGKRVLDRINRIDRIGCIA